MVITPRTACGREHQAGLNIFIASDILEKMKNSIASAIQSNDWLQAEKDIFHVALAIMHEAAHWAVYKAKGAKESYRLEVNDQGFVFMKKAFNEKFTGSSGSTAFGERLDESIVYKYYEDNYIGILP